MLIQQPAVDVSERVSYRLAGARASRDDAAAAFSSRPPGIGDNADAGSRPLAYAISVPVVGFRVVQRSLAIRASRLLDRIGLAEPAFRVYQRVKARGADPAPAIAPDGLPLPPSQLRYEVIGYTDVDVFLDTGRAQAAVLKEQLRDVLEPPARLLDFGVGCGRVARHWRDPGVQVHGVDYNRRLVAWVQTHLPSMYVTENDLAPPLRYPDGFFDAVYAISVLTHWPADLQVKWMREFRRVLRPGGRLVVTTHGASLGASVVSYVLDDERAQFAAGELVVRNPRSRGSNLCVTYHPPQWVRAHLLDDFEELSWVATEPAFDQDVWVLRAT
jgi:SAM-dependent methyltransferase